MPIVGLVALLGFGGLAVVNSPGAYAATSCPPTSTGAPSDSVTGPGPASGQPGAPAAPSEPATPAAPTTPATPTGSPTPTDTPEPASPATPVASPTPTEPAEPTTPADPTPSTPPVAPVDPPETTDPGTPHLLNAVAVAFDSSFGSAGIENAGESTDPLPAGATFHLSFSIVAANPPDLAPGTPSSASVTSISPSLSCVGITAGETFGPAMTVDIEADCTLLADLAPGESATVRLDQAAGLCTTLDGPDVTIELPSGFVDSDPADNHAHGTTIVRPCIPLP